MAEEKTAFSLKFEIEDAKKDLKQLRREQPEDAPGAPRREVRRGLPRRRRGFLPLPRRAAGRPPIPGRTGQERLKQTRAQTSIAARAGVGRVTPAFLGRATQIGIRVGGEAAAGLAETEVAAATAGVGGAAASLAGRVIKLGAAVAGAALFAALNSEKIGFITEVIPGGKVLKPLVEVGKEVKAQVKGAFQTIGQSAQLAKAFGAIGEPPPLDTAAEIVGGLFEANKAKVRLETDIQENLLTSGASVFVKAMKQQSVGQAIADLKKQFAAKPAGQG